MPVYTSYFANHRNFPKDSTLVSIARKSPQGMFNLKSLAPSLGLLNKYKDGKIDEVRFEEVYIEEVKYSLLNTDTFMVLNNIIKNNENVILLCYEKDDFCHRHILREFLSDVLDIKEL